MNNNKVKVWLPLLFSFAMIIGMYLGYKMRDAMPGKSFFYTEKRRPVQEIIDLINNKYVDDVNMQAITDTAIQAILHKLDPHSVFIPVDELSKVNEDLAGKFFGIGIEFNIISDTLNVTHVLKDGPSFKAGIETGDKLIKVNDSSIAGIKINIDKIRKLLRGDKGTTVSLTLLRNGNGKIVTVTRDAIPLSSIDANYMIANGIGYIKLNKFSQETYREFMRAMEDMQKQGLKKLILDLRGNGGGILDNAIEIADEFIDGNKLITYTEGKHLKKKEYKCKRNGLFEKGALVVLADEGSASASEVLLGALQDWDRATIIGRRTFGKGLVQEQYNLSDGSALRLTIARYYTPIGRSIQRSYSKGEKEYYNEITNRYYDGETTSADSVKNDSSKIFKTINGKTVYGGGGISPDIFVAIDTGLIAKAMIPFYTKNTISDFAYTFYLANKEALLKYKTTNNFIANFSFTDNNWNQFLSKVASDSIAFGKVSLPQKQDLMDKIKAGIARIIWRNEGYFQVINNKDKMINKALEVLQ
jgi:carboxyl-terminal processing protease